LSEDVPTGERDELMDVVVTEDAVYRRVEGAGIVA
jgi:hypothetical protein